MSLEIKKETNLAVVDNLIVSIGSALSEKDRDRLYKYTEDTRSEASNDEAYKVIEKVFEFIKKANV
jgi:hypothetical protein